MPVKHLLPLLLLLSLPVQAQDDAGTPDEAFLEFLAQFNPEEEDIIEFAFADEDNMPVDEKRKDRQDEVENETAN